MKRYRRAFLVTVSTAGSLSCSSPEPTEPVSHNPPEIVDVPTASLTAAETAPPLASASSVATIARPLSSAPINHGDFERELNPRDAEKRTVKLSWDGKSCLVELPFKTPPTSVQAPPTRTVPCPPELRDPAFLACAGGEVMTNAAASECICVQHGNPPPPTKRIACPKHP